MFIAAAVALIKVVKRILYFKYSKEITIILRVERDVLIIYTNTGEEKRFKAFK